MTADILNSMGLVFNILGVILIFFFGLPQPSHDEGVSLGFGEATVFEDGTSVKEINAKTKKRKDIYRGFAYFALSLILLGFIFQLLSIWVCR
ncbi:hypothetical protein [Shewanella baltica]|uniref:hypothetical protein n=1 Tax=Shewanella baltica TaxID=62322 RepID=UPI00217E1163|nr:hypothetical protein [Shewanella baltica]MCS6101292.1 hypothetical protein [Shewanella baltica]MCS6184263.1 hypothetical protein [Shewanella baltica]